MPLGKCLAMFLPGLILSSTSVGRTLRKTGSSVAKSTYSKLAGDGTAGS